MINKTAMIAASLLLVLGLGACDKPGPGERAGKKLDEAASDVGKKMNDTAERVDKTVSGQGDAAGDAAALALDDTEITARVKAAILAEPGLRSLQISVETHGGIVTLTGSVDSPATFDKVAAMALAVKGVKDVRNELVVVSGK